MLWLVKLVECLVSGLGFYKLFVVWLVACTCLPACMQQCDFYSECDPEHLIHVRTIFCTVECMWVLGRHRWDY